MGLKRSSWVTGLLVLLSVAAAKAEPAKPFYLKPGDRVVFYGDSITDQRLYTTYIETYCISRYPNAHFTFFHSGWGGDRVTGGGGGPIDTRLKRDVLAYKPSVVTICLGMNDGSYRAFDKGIFDTYVKGYRHILDTLIKELPGVRITLLTASAYDDVTRQPGFLGGYNATLVAYGEAVRELGREYGLAVADTNAPLVAALARAHAVDADLSTQIIRDRVHPGPGGHLLMAAAVIRAWNAPSLAADVDINVSDEHLHNSSAHHAQLSDVKMKDGALSFTEKDFIIPWPLDRDPNNNKDMILTLSVTEVEADLNTFRLKVSGLKTASYKLTVDDTDCGSYTAEALGAGIDLESIQGTPMYAQAQKVLQLTRKHNDIHFRRWRQVQVTQKSDGLNPSSDVLTQMNSLDAEDAAAEQESQSAAAPAAHKFVLTPGVKRRMARTRHTGMLN